MACAVCEAITGTEYIYLFFMWNLVSARLQSSSPFGISLGNRFAMLTILKWAKYDYVKSVYDIRK